MRFFHSVIKSPQTLYYTRLSQFLTPQFLTILTILNTFFQNGQFSEVAQEAGKYYFMFTIERWGFEYPVGAGK